MSWDWPPKNERVQRLGGWLDQLSASTRGYLGATGGGGTVTTVGALTRPAGTKPVRLTVTTGAGGDEANHTRDPQPGSWAFGDPDCPLRSWSRNAFAAFNPILLDDYNLFAGYFNGSLLFSSASVYCGFRSNFALYGDANLRAVVADGAGESIVADLGFPLGTDPLNFNMFRLDLDGLGGTTWLFDGVEVAQATVVLGTDDVSSGIDIAKVAGVSAVRVETAWDEEVIAHPEGIWQP